MLLAERIATCASAISHESLPPEAVHWAKVGILDYLGVPIAGSTKAAARIRRTARSRARLR